MSGTINKYKLYWRPNIYDDGARFGDPAARPFDANEGRPEFVFAHRFEIVTDNGTEIRFYIISDEGEDELTTAILDIPYMVTKIDEVPE